MHQKISLINQLLNNHFRLFVLSIAFSLVMLSGCNKTVETSKTQANSGTIKLEWKAPSQNTDNSQLNDLSGYKIYYGTNPSQLTEVITINTPTRHFHEFTNMKIGTTYYFSISALNKSGVESEKTAVISKTLLK